MATVAPAAAAAASRGSLAPQAGRAASTNNAPLYRDDLASGNSPAPAHPSPSLMPGVPSTPSPRTAQPALARTVSTSQMAKQRPRPAAIRRPQASASGGNSPYSAAALTSASTPTRGKLAPEPGTPNSAKRKGAGQQAVRGSLQPRGSSSPFDKSKTVTSVAREREEREQEREAAAARLAYEEANRMQRVAADSAPRGRPARARLIDRKPNLRVQTQHSRIASYATQQPRKDGAPMTPKKPGTAQRAAGSRKAAVPAQSRLSSVPAATFVASLPGTVEDGASGDAERSITVGRDRHHSIIGQSIPTLSGADGGSESAGALDENGAAANSASGLSHHTLLLASTFLDNAHRFYSPHHRHDLLGLRVLLVYRHWAVRALVFAIILLNMSLTYLQSKPSLSAGGLQALEFLLLTMLTAWTAVELWLFPSRRKRLKSSRFTSFEFQFRGSKRRLSIPLWRDRWDQAKLVLLCISFLDLFIAMGGATSLYRIAMPCRGYFLATYSHDTRTQVKQVFNTIRSMFIPFVMVLLLVFFETSLAVILFHSADSGNDYFASLHDSFIAMVALGTTDNFPDITFPAIDAYGLYSVLFFILCLIIGLYVTVSLLIAYVYTTWREQAVVEYWCKLKNRESNLKNAFNLLVAGSVEKWKEEKREEKLHAKPSTEPAEPDTAAASPEPKDGTEKLLSLTAWSHLFSFINPQLQAMESAILSRVFFLLLTTTSTVSCSQQDFLDLCEHFHSLTSLTSKDAMQPKSSRALAIQAVFEHRFAQYARSALVVLEAVLVVSCFTAASSSDSLYSPVYAFVLDCLYCVWLCVEICLSVYINSWRRYISSPWKRASLVIASVSIVGKLSTELMVQPVVRDPTLSVYRAALFFRVLRLLRVPLIIKRFRLGLKSLVRVLEPLMSLLVYLIFVYYEYALLGELCFSGLLSPTSPPASILQSEFYTSGYYLYFHFNDFPTALWTLFHFMAGTNWSVTVQALMLVSGQWAFLYYLCFYFIICICTLNLVIAYLVETLEIAVKNLSEERQDKDGERRQRREAELWAKEMILMEAANTANGGEGTTTALVGATERRRSSLEEEGGEKAGEAQSPGGAEGESVVTRTVSVAPTIEKRKKRVGVFEEDALKHAQLNAGKTDHEEEEESISRARDSSQLYAGIDEELGGGETESGAEGAETGAAAEAGKAKEKPEEESKEASPEAAAPSSVQPPATKRRSTLLRDEMQLEMGSPRARQSTALQPPLSTTTAAPLAGQGQQPALQHPPPLIASRPLTAAGGSPKTSPALSPLHATPAPAPSASPQPGSGPIVSKRVAPAGKKKVTRSGML